MHATKKLFLLFFLFILSASLATALCEVVSETEHTYSCFVGDCLKNVFCNDEVHLCVVKIVDGEVSLQARDDELQKGQFWALSDKKIFDVFCEINSTNSDFKHTLTLLHVDAAKITFKIADFDSDDYWKRVKKDLQNLDESRVNSVKKNQVCILETDCEEGLHCVNYVCKKQSLFKRLFYRFKSIF